jgi:histidinol phosphatase-like PHP family hydrolase
MKGFVLPDGISEPADIAKLMVKRFNEMIALHLATGVAHPFLPCGFTNQTDEIIAAISDAEFIDSFTRAAQAGTSIEVHAGFFDGSRGKAKEGFHDDTFLRVLSIAKKCGCYFHFSSDSHSLATLDTVMLLEPYAKELGLTKNDILPCLR